MASGIWTTEYFTCPDCGMPYSATKEEHPDKRSGSFSCNICGGEVHAWSGVYDFFDWKTDKAKSPVFGKKKFPTSVPDDLGTEPAGEDNARR